MTAPERAAPDAVTIAVADIPSDGATTPEESAAASTPFGLLTIRLRGCRRFVPGLWVVVVVSMAAAFVAERFGGSQMLYALLFGIAFRFLYVEPSCDAGIEFASRALLRFAVALLGAHITFA